MADIYEVFLQLPAKKRLLGLVLVLLGLVISAVVGALVTDYFARARPNVELAAVTFNGILRKDSKLTVTPILRKAYEDAPMDFNEFKAQITLEALRGMIVSTREYNTTLPEELAILKEVTSTLEKSPLDANKDTLRYQLLRRWVDAPGHILDSVVRDAVSKTDRVRSLTSDKRYAHYAKHPDVAPWNSPETAIVWIDATKSYRLSEEKVFDTDNTQTRQAKFAVSLYRRLWIYLDRDLFLEILKEAEATINELVTRCSAFEKALAVFEEVNNPRRVEANVVITNTGKSPLIIRTAGLLRLSSSQKQVDIRVLTAVDDQMTENSILTVAPGDGKVVKFYSNETAKEISDRDFGGNLQAVYDSEVLACAFGCVRVSSNATDQLVLTTRKANFGARIRESTIQELANRLR